jgi:hypothetical protein
MPSQLERTPQLSNGRYSERGWVCTVHLPPSPGWANFFHHDGMYARKWQLPLCVYGVVVSANRERQQGLASHNTVNIRSNLSAQNL